MTDEYRQVENRFIKGKSFTTLVGLPHLHYSVSANAYNTFLLTSLVPTFNYILYSFVKHVQSSWKVDIENPSRTGLSVQKVSLFYGTPRIYLYLVKIITLWQQV